MTFLILKIVLHLVKFEAINMGEDRAKNKRQI
jgi:hypothetical protein